MIQCPKRSGPASRTYLRPGPTEAHPGLNQVKALQAPNLKCYAALGGTPRRKTSQPRFSTSPPRLHCITGQTLFVAGGEIMP